MIYILGTVLSIIHIYVSLIELQGNEEKQSKIFNIDIEFIKQSNAQIALKNIGIYNLALSICILMGLLVFRDAFLSSYLLLQSIFVLIVGIFGAITITKKILYVQVIPASITIIYIIIEFLSK